VLHPKISIEEKGGNVYTQLRRDLREINGAFVKVGFPEGGKVGYPSRHKIGPVESKDMGEVAKIAAWNEFGVPKTQAETMRGIMTGRSASPWKLPPRPAMRSAVDGNFENLKAFKAKVYEQVLDGKLTPKQGLDMLGLWMQNKMKNSILHGHWQKNAPSTLKQKHGSTKPLIDTAQELNSVTWTNSLDK
jgi:hypothetical protein